MDILYYGCLFGVCGSPGQEIKLLSRSAHFWGPKTLPAIFFLMAAQWEVLPWKSSALSPSLVSDLAIVFGQGCFLSFVALLFPARDHIWLRKQASKETII